MVLRDKGADEQFYTDLLDASDEYAAENNTLIHPEVAAAEFYHSIGWLIEGAHSSDIGVVHRLIRNKLGRS